MTAKKAKKKAGASLLDRIAERARKGIGSKDKDRVFLGSSCELGDPKIWLPLDESQSDLAVLLDRDLRGWPCGRIIEVFGGEGTCKTALGYDAIARAQAQGGIGILYLAEGEYSEWLAKAYKVDVESLLILDENRVEKVFSTIHEMIKEKSDVPVVIVVDSVAGMVTTDEAGSDEFDQSRAAQKRALLISAGLRRLGFEIPKTNVLLFLINQTRTGKTTPTGMQGKDQPPGGKAIAFYSSIRLRMEVKDKIRRQRKGRKKVVAMRLKLTAEKGRLADPFQESTLVVDFNEGILPGSAYTKKGPTVPDDEPDLEFDAG